MNDITKKTIRLRRTIDKTDVEIEFSDPDELTDAIHTLDNISQRLSIEKIKQKTIQFWVQKNEVRKIIDDIKDGTHRVSLSLFEVWPDCKRAGQIQQDTGLSSGSVSNILMGRQGGCGSWFNQCPEGWRLSSKGIEDMEDKIISIYN